MQGRFAFDNYLGMVLFALMCTFFLGAVVILLGPQIDACFCQVRLMGQSSPGGWGCCGRYPEPWVFRPYLILCVVLLGISILVAVSGIVLGRTRRMTIDRPVLYALELSPFLTLVFLGVVGCLVYMYADMVLLR